MKKHLSVLLAGLVIGCLASAVFAASSHDAHSTITDHSGHIGEKIHESTVEGYRLAYHLLDLPGREVKHLITYIVDAAGKPVNDAKVGFLVVDPGGNEQMVMAMTMKDSFGGDVDFSLKGKYTIKSKAVVGDKNLLDSFTYVVD